MNQHTQHHKKDWLETLEKRLSQGTSPLLSPDELDKGWAKLSQQLPLSPKARHKHLIYRYAIAAAASLFILLGIGFEFFWNPAREIATEGESRFVAQQSLSVEPKAPSLAPTQTHQGTTSLATTAPHKNLTAAKKVYVEDRKAESKEETSTDRSDRFVAEPFPLQDNLQELQTKQSSNASPSSQEEDLMPRDSFDPIMPQSKKQSEDKETFSLGLLASNATLSYSAPQPMLTNKLMSLATDLEAPYASAYKSAKFNHSLPISFGVKAAYNLAYNFRVETGLVYSYHYSQLLDYGAPGRTKTQQLHYLGMPLGVSYTFWRSGSFSSYVSAMMQMDRLLVAKVTDRDSPESPYQLSSHLKVGATYKISRHLSLFVEGGAAYFFDDKSNLNTYYKEHPFSVNFCGGFLLGY